MPMGKEPERVGTPIVTEREPQGPVRAGDKGSIGDVALMDAIVLVLACWLFLFLIGFSLRRHSL
jgi:hypothetical protein